jgi:hypothetical protein
MRGFFRRVRETFSGEPANHPDQTLDGILVFSNTSEVIAAETCLKQAGFDVRVMGPPAALRTGCDLVIAFALIRQLEVLEMLRTKRIEPLQVVPVQDVLLEPVSLFQTVDYGAYLMVRAANMKLTIRKQDRTIVNVSGGGCPDVPYLAERLIGMQLAAEHEPRRYGKTLCGYALQLAWEEMKRQCPLG